MSPSGRSRNTRALVTAAATAAAAVVDSRPPINSALVVGTDCRRRPRATSWRVSPGMAWAATQAFVVGVSSRW
jgi:3-hydroxy-3-methylglutaryl CoA synthase